MGGVQMSEKTRGKYRRYSREFKEEAVNLVVVQGYSIAEAARNLGINANMLGRWKQDSGGSSPSGDDKAELARLRKENERLRMEREILKKAAAFFANESNAGTGSSTR
jgi:transposase